MKNILLPIDFYQDPRPALGKILTFLEGVEGRFRLFLLNTYMVPISPSDRLITTHDTLRNQSLNKLKDLLQTVNGASSDKVSLETISQMGLPANVISRIVPERKIDCVIIGRDIPEGVSRLLHQIPCPVIIL